jgi:hypothetical protein
MAVVGEGYPSFHPSTFWYLVKVLTPVWTGIATADVKTIEAQWRSLFHDPAPLDNDSVDPVTTREWFVEAVLVLLHESRQGSGVLLPWEAQTILSQCSAISCPSVEVIVGWFPGSSPLLISEEGALGLVAGAAALNWDLELTVMGVTFGSEALCNDEGVGHRLQRDRWEVAPSRYRRVTVGQHRYYVTERSFAQGVRAVSRWLGGTPLVVEAKRYRCRTGKE